MVRLICSSGGDTEDSGDHCPDQTSLTDSGRDAIGFRANMKKKKKSLCFYSLSLSYLFFAHYNIQPDSVSSRPGVTPARNHGGCTLKKIRVTESAVIIMMMGDSASEPNIIANDSGPRVYVCVRPHNAAQSESVLL